MPKILLRDVASLPPDLYLHQDSLARFVSTKAFNHLETFHGQSATSPLDAFTR